MDVFLKGSLMGYFQEGMAYDGTSAVIKSYDIYNFLTNPIQEKHLLVPNVYLSIKDINNHKSQK